MTDYKTKIDFDYCHCPALFMVVVAAAAVIITYP